MAFSMLFCSDDGEWNGRCYLFSNNSITIKRIMKLGQMFLRLEKRASRVVLKTTTNKTEASSCQIPPNSIYVLNLDGVDPFVYPGSVLSADGGSERDVTRRINSTRFTTVLKEFRCSNTNIITNDGATSACGPGTDRQNGSGSSHFKKGDNSVEANAGNGIHYPRMVDE